MPNQVIPVTGLDTVGLIEDTPSVSLPPNAFTDVLNVRFHDGAARQFHEDMSLALLNENNNNLFAFGDNIQHVTGWHSTDGFKYVVVHYNDAATTANIDIFDEDAHHNSTLSGTMPTSAAAIWQHTIFNGGHHIVLNNGITTPRYLTAGAALGPQELPGWHSYAAERELLSYEADGSGSAFVVDVPLEAGTRIKITNLPRNTAIPIYSQTVTVNPTVTNTVEDSTLDNIGTIDLVNADGFTFSPNDATGGNTFRMSIVGEPITDVVAGVIRAYGNLLVAGNLSEDGGRTLTGTIRTSDVAAPGEIPQNWNPFNLGVNTADEFILASTGTIQDMAELQGVLYVYTDQSIHAIQQTGSPVLPFQITTVTDNYGADGVGSVIEVDGKHVVVGSDDVYIFAGHPGSISSIADGRVRDNFRTNKGYRIIRYNAYDELWFFQPENGTKYIWNYRTNIWTKRRDGDTPRSLNNGAKDLLLGIGARVYTIQPSNGLLRGFKLERDRMAINPEFDVEQLTSIAFLATGTADVNILVRGSNTPGDTTGPTGGTGFTFDTTSDYKTDIRVTGRFLNLSIEEPTAVNLTVPEFTLSGLQLDIGKGGQR